MNKPMIATLALIAGIAIASPMIAWSANDQPSTEPSAAAQGMPVMGPGMMGFMQDQPGLDPLGHPGGMREMMMHRMMHMAPPQRCAERLARRAGLVAYTVTKLNLTAEQRPLWDRLNAILQAGTEKEQRLCASLPSVGPAGGQPGQTTILDRVNRVEQFLSTELQTVQQARPALEQFYQALTTEQKAVIDRPFPRS